MHEDFIGLGFTDGVIPASQRAKHADSEASLRENLAAQVAGAQNELSSSLVALRASVNVDAALIGQGDSQLGALLALKQRLSTASPAMLASIHAEINAAVAAASNVAQQAQAALGGSSSDTALNLSAASQASRAAVGSFEENFYKKKIFDPYLRFSSAEDEERYRRDEATRKAEIEQAVALHTPQGDLKANSLALDQLRDAGAHGADRSPEYQPTLDRLMRSDADLSAQLGVSRSNSAPATTAVPDPLDTPAAAAPHVSQDLIAKFKATGTIVADQASTGHGVSADVATQRGAAVQL